MTDFNSLEKALDSWFSCSLAELPNPLRRRVISDFWIAKWDDLSPAQRRSFAQQHDFQHDPSTRDQQEFWFNFYVDLQELDRQIEEWERVGTPSALDLKQKESEVQVLREKKAHLERLKGIFLERRFPRIPDTSDSRSGEADEEVYLAFPAALARLKGRLDTNIEEIAAWIFMGPDEGGLRAFTKPRHGSGVSRFWFQPEMDPNYESLVFNCWFLEREIEGYEPRERFVSGKALVARWGSAMGENAKTFVLAKVGVGELTDLHPVRGATNATVSDSNDFPEMETGLFSLSEIKLVEQEQGIEYSESELFMEKSEEESPEERRDRILNWLEVESRLGGKRGAIQRVAEREGVTRQRISQIIGRESE